MTPEFPPEPPASPLLPPAVPPTKPRRPPVPWWMWLMFTVGAPFMGATLGALIGLPARSQAGFSEAVGAGGAWGVFSIPVLALGLALSGRFFSGTGPRIVGTFLFTFLVLLGLAAVFFAGCMCLLYSNRQMFHG